MCVVSMIYDHYHDKWRQYFPPPSNPWVTPTVQPVQPPISQEEIAEFRKLLERARQYDKDHNQPDCELEEKRKKLKELSEQLGVSIEFV